MIPIGLGFSNETLKMLTLVVPDQLGLTELCLGLGTLEHLLVFFDGSEFPVENSVRQTLRQLVGTWFSIYCFVYFGQNGVI